MSGESVRPGMPPGFMRRSVVDPKADGRRRHVLLVTTSEEAGSTIASDLGRDDVVRVVVPVVGQSALDWLANDETAFSNARGLAERTARAIPADTFSADAGDDDFELAVRDALATFPADEVIVFVERADDPPITPSEKGTFDGVPVRFVSIG